MLRAAEALIARLEAKGARWPSAFELEHHLTVARYAAHRWGDREALKRYHPDWKSSRTYKYDPLPELISGAFANLLFGEDVVVTAAATGDQVNVDRIEEASDLGAELWRAQDTSSSEGEIWGRIVSRPDLLDAPQIAFSSRRDVVPLYVGAKLVAVAFVTDYVEQASANDSRPLIRRLFEIHAEGEIVNVLYEGTPDTLGPKVDLSRVDELEDVDEETTTGLPMLAARVRNRVGPSVTLGRSDFEPIEDFLFDLNESVAIAAENARLTAKKRAIVSGALTSSGAPEPSAGVDLGDGSIQPVEPTVDLGADVLVSNGLDGELGRDGGGPFKVLEYQFDAEALIAHKRDLITSAVTRIGPTPQFVGISLGSDGQAESGTALRVRLFPTSGAGRGRLRPWKVGLPWLMMLAQLVDASPEPIGFGRSYTSAGEAPGVKIDANIPEDESELVQRHATAVGAEIESRRTAIKSLRPDWTDQQIDDEIKAIDEDAQSSASRLGLGSFGNGPAGPPAI